MPTTSKASSTKTNQPKADPTESPVYVSSTTKRKRRTKAAITGIKAELYKIVEENQPCTVRQAFYQCVSKGLIDKSETEYQRTVIRLLADMRKCGELPFEWVADNTRWQRKPSTHSSLESMMRHQQTAYRRAMWDEQEVHVEIWLEKEALAGVLYEITGQWDCPLYVTRGYSSLSFLYGAAEYMSNIGKDCHIIYFGDHDPSGVDIGRNTHEQLENFAEVDIEFSKIAVTPEQIKSMNLLTRPTKKTDPRSKNFKGESVEVDAIPPKKLRELCQDSITQHIDEKLLKRSQKVERAERETLEAMVKILDGGVRNGRRVR